MTKILCFVHNGYTLGAIKVQIRVNKYARQQIMLIFVWIPKIYVFHIYYLYIIYIYIFINNVKIIITPLTKL